MNFNLLKNDKNKLLEQYFVLIVLIMALFFFTTNCITIKSPYVHSDEIWLSKIAENTFNKGDVFATEPFFDNYFRAGHIFRWLYNLGLLPFLTFTPTYLAARMLSLTLATLSIIVFSFLLRVMRINTKLIYLANAALIFNIQFVVSAHIGRQESFIVFLILLGAFAAYRNNRKSSLIITTIITAAAMGVHPNALFVAAVIFAIYLMTNYKMAIKYFLIVTMVFIGYIIIGNLLKPDFFYQYLQYGKQLGFMDSTAGRLEGFYYFFPKLFSQIGGTYYLYDIKIFLILTFALILGMPFINPQKSSMVIWVAMIGIIVSYFIIGRYNQLSIIFLIVFSLIALTNFVNSIKIQTNYKLLIMIILVAASAFNLHKNIENYKTQNFYSMSYDTMISKVSAAVPSGSRVLGNLNVIEACDYENFWDIRNLAKVENIGEYLSKRKIEYIIWHEEMEYIYKNRDRWGFLYGEMDYYNDLMDIFSEAEIVTEFENGIYAMRIARYMGEYPWYTRIYKLKKYD